jgi:hypothetical protein
MAKLEPRLRLRPDRMKGRDRTDRFGRMISLEGFNTE